MPTHKRNQVNSVSHAINSEKIMHLPGSIIGSRYQIIQKLGREETVRTYLAKDLQAKVDARCIVEQLAYQSENEANWQIIQQHLLNEIAILTRLGDHPQIPKFHDYFAENELFYLVREYIDGDNLEQEIERKVFDEADTINLIQDTLRILDFIHKTNVIHRDIQPTNLIRRKQDKAIILINFGAVRELELGEIDLEGKLILSDFVGNCSYIAPEQKTGVYDPSSDLYALAKTAVFALTAQSPQKLEEMQVDWRSQCHISLKLSTILTKMMSSNVEQRYSSALEVLYDLRPLLKIRQTVGGRYSITRYLGGKNGIETYLADNLRRQYQSPCLIKQIELPNAGNDKVKLERRFAEELSVLERLGYHEQIPQLWDHFEENDEFYLVQEYIAGDNLAQKIAQQELSTAQIIQILISALSLLKFIHQNRIIHRNLKPSNLIIRAEDQQVILTDFGIIGDIKTGADSNLIHSQVQDKHDYWSPEQIAGRPTVSSDIYALGMTVIEALTTVKPGIFNREPSGKLLWTENVNLDRRLIRIIDQMVQLNLGQRYQSADKVLSDLQKVNLNFHRQPLDRRSPQTVKRGNRPKSAKIPILIGLLGMACLLGSIEFAFPVLRPVYYWYQGQKLLPEQPQPALDLFTKAIDLKPQSSPAWSGRGDALSILQRYPQALEAYIESSELNPDNAQSWKKQGKILYRLEKYHEAIAKYDRALDLERNDAEIYNLKGQALFQLQQYETALTMQETALEQDQRNPQFLSDLAQNLRSLRRYSEALKVFNQVQEIAPSNLLLWQDKFLVLEALQRPQEADRVRREVSNNYVKILQQQPQNESAWLAQGDFFTTARMYEKALDSYNQAIKLKPNQYKALLAKANTLSQLGRTEDALDTLDIALKVRPQSYLALQAKGSINQNRGNLTQAIANYDQAIEINPDFAPLWRDQGLVLSQQGNYTQAIKSLSKASKLADYDAQTWQGLAEAWDAMGKNQSALSAINRAIEINPQNPELWRQKGLIYTKNAQYNEACETYRKSRVPTLNSPAILDMMKLLKCRMN
jgi:eukaryotic-like serine/threonine-protein kinase